MLSHSSLGHRTVNCPGPKFSMQSLAGLLTGLKAHAVCAAFLFAIVNWALLSPDPFALIRQSPAGWLARLDDFFQHLGAFGTLSLVLFSLSLRTTGTISASLAATIAVYAGCTELLQAYVPGRTCDPADALANIGGILFGFNLVFAHSAWQRRSDRRNVALETAILQVADSEHAGNA
jgi:VanZ family protein